MKATENYFSKLKLWFALALLTALIVSPHRIAAQIDTVTVTGLVADTSGAAVAGARVTAINQGTSIATDSVTNEEGYYTLTNLRPGLYTIEVEQTGFKRESRPDVRLSVGQRVRLDFSVSVGQVAETVTITGDALVLQREDASLGNVVDNRRISTLPLPQRTWDDLLTQVAGRHAGRPLHRTVRRHGGRAHGRSQCSRCSVADE